MSRNAVDATRFEPLRIGIVGYGLDRPGTGISRYAGELLRALRARHPDIAVVLLRPFSGGAPGLADLDDGETVRLPGTRLLPAMMAIGPIAITAAARRHRLHVVHDPTGISPFLVPRRLGRFARIVTIHDAVPFVYPETQTRLTNALFHHYLPRALPSVDRVVTVSESSRRDLVRFLGLSPDRIACIPCGVAARFRPPPPAEIARVLDRHRIAGPYLLAVGSLEPRKNLRTLFEAYHRLRTDGLPHRLVIVGHRAWKSASVFQRLDELGLADLVTLTGYVDDDDLPGLYAGATCFIFPSLYEGFGLPPLEAMACGTPVVASRASSLPEVVGEAALTVDPRDVDGFAAAIRRVVEAPAVAEALRSRGLQRAAALTWEHAAAAHARLYRDVAPLAGNAGSSRNGTGTFDPLSADDQ